MSKIIHLPGLIDIHVHLRDPGQTYKEDFYSGTAAALAGGITTIFDMPNNLEPIVSYQKLLEKLIIAQKKAVCDWGLYFGTDGRNTAEFDKVADKVVGLKLYLNLTTGKLFITDDKLVDKVFKSWPKAKVIVVHAEGERIDLAIRLGQKYGNKLHLTHIGSKNDLQKIIAAKKDKLKLTCDVTPHHLFLTDEDLKKLNGFGIVKPPLATKKNQDFLWEHINDIDCIATDHAPHTIEEKQSNNPPSGMPGLETMWPILLTAVKQRRLTVKEIIRLINTNPQKIFEIKQVENTYVEVDLEEKYIIKNKNLFTKCDWSPFTGWEVQGKVRAVYIRGTKVFQNNKILVSPGFGKQIASS